MDLPEDLNLDQEDDQAGDEGEGDGKGSGVKLRVELTGLRTIRNTYFLFLSRRESFRH